MGGAPCRPTGGLSLYQFTVEIPSGDGSTLSHSLLWRTFASISACRSEFGSRIFSVSARLSSLRRRRRSQRSGVVDRARRRVRVERIGGRRGRAGGFASRPRGARRPARRPRARSSRAASTSARTRSASERSETRAVTSSREMRCACCGCSSRLRTSWSTLRSSGPRRRGATGTASRASSPRAARCDRGLDVPRLGADGERELRAVLAALDGGGNEGDQRAPPPRRRRPSPRACCSPSPPRGGSRSRAPAAPRRRASRSASAPSRARKLSGSSPGGSAAARTRSPWGNSTSRLRSIARWPASSPSNSSTTSRVRRRSFRPCSSVSAVPQVATALSIPARCRAIEVEVALDHHGALGAPDRLERGGKAVERPRACGRRDSRACSGTWAPGLGETARPPKPITRPWTSWMGNVTRPRSRS